MQKAELTALVDAACANWGSPVGDKTQLYRTWWRYLSDVEYQAALSALDDFVIAGQRFMPRVGEIRRSALNSTNGWYELPDLEGAWALAASRWSAVDMGVEPVFTGNADLDALIGDAMRQAGAVDKRAFSEAWNHVRAVAEQSRYQLPEEAPGLS